jgi:CheY-like chemotaxis protein
VAELLVVDDNAANLALLSYVLRAAGHEVHTATSAEEALAALDRRAPRMLLLDLRLPGMDGLTLARRLRADPRHDALIIVAVTAQAMRGDREAAIEAGCDGFVTKPIDTRALPATVAEHLRAGATPRRR